MRDWIKRTFKVLGPGFIAGAADDDPAGIVTYTQAGVTLGYHALWTALFSIPFMIVVQDMCARIGIVTGRGLAANMCRRFPRWLVIGLVALLFAANTLNLGADIGMMAAATKLVIPLPFPLLVIGLALVTLVIQIFATYEACAKYLKWLTLSLFAYIIVAFLVNDVDWMRAVRGTFVPGDMLNKEALMILVAVLGTTISPYLFFWQASEEVEEQWGERGRPKKLTARLGTRMQARLRDMRADVGWGMVFSNVVAWFIMLLAASKLRDTGYGLISSPEQVAAALEPLAGKFASLLFALATLGTGLLTVPVLSASAAYAVCEVLEIPEGLSKKWYQAQAFYGLIIVSTLIGVAGNFTGTNPVRALIYSGIANALVAPLLLVAVVLLASDKKLMGKYVSTPKIHVVGWATVGLMTAAPLLWAYATWKGW